MAAPEEAMPTADPRRVGRKRLHRIVRRTLYVKLALVFGLAVCCAAAYLRLVAGPVSLSDYSARVGEALSERIGPGWKVTLGDSAVELVGSIPALRASGLELRNPDGVVVVRAPFAIVSLDPLRLLTGSFVPREIELRDLQLRALLASNGHLTFVPQDDAAGAPSLPIVPEPRKDGADGPSFLSVAVASLLDEVLGPGSLVGALDRASVSNARLTVIGGDGRERVAFSRVGARFEHAAPGERRIAADLEGPHGAWSVRGDVRQQDGTAKADLEASSVPLPDLMLLGGMSGVPSDLALSARLSATLADGRLSDLTGRFDTSPGSITGPGGEAVRLDGFSGTMAWDEAARALRISDLDARGGVNRLRLAGDLMAAGDVWKLRLSGQDASVASVTAGEPPVRVADVAASLSFAEGGVTLDQLALKGEALDVNLSGSMATSGDGLRASIEASRTNLRKLLALWPATVNQELRRYLVANMVGGTVDRMRIGALLDRRDLERAGSGERMSHEALDLAFSVSNATLNLPEGLPPLRKLSFDGEATGPTTVIKAREGRIEVRDGLALTMSEGTYRQEPEGGDPVARIAFRLGGPIDGLASLLRLPALRDPDGPDLEPGAVTGRADLRIGFRLNLARPARPLDLPLSIGGKLTDVASDKLLGRDKLEAGSFAVTLEAGNLSLKGDARISGAPAQIEYRQAKGQPGEATASLVLDEAARSRRGLPVGSGLSGPVPVRVVATSLPGRKRQMRVEADLGRATIENILPGWTKAAGKPGRLSFVMPDADAPDLRDVVLDAGPVQIKGSASFGADGTLDRADLPTFRLSTGDDLRASVDRSGGIYRLALKGNMADARPVLRWLTATPGTRSGRDGGDYDVEAALNIVTGFNDEAATGLILKASTRGRELKLFQLSGKFRQVGFEAQLLRREGAPPTLSLQSGDAGATLRFVDLYRRMVGGALNVQAALTDGAQAGSVVIDGFVLKNEPALRRIAAAGTSIQAGSEDRAGVLVPQLGGDQVVFTKLTGEFRRSASRIEYKDAVAWGPQVGINLSGFVDYARDRTDISGTFVPAYQLNNAFSQLPVLGLILGGDRNEGLFALNFHIAGPASGPTMTVNPLSAVTPGILRKLFGWITEGGDQTGTTAPAGPAPTRSDK